MRRMRGRVEQGPVRRRPTGFDQLMIAELHSIELATTEPIQVLDCTEQLTELLKPGRVRTGLLTVISNHTTAFVTINENERRLHQDMVTFLRKVAPPAAGYGHDLEPVDDRQNAHAHLAGLFMSASQGIPIVDGCLMLGTWQSILFVELDGPRPRRTLQVQILGEPGP